ncbi:MAG: RecX family transcriptional regulator [Candidatus Borkfalkiaceae bacterium]|nr:RecX family transcriptional regulator [Christensenellaceae bacterium]
MKITQISAQQKNKDRCNIFINGEYSFSVSTETVYKFYLKTGKELSEEEITAIKEDGERTSALNRATEYISKAYKTRKQVKDYLLKKGYSDDAVYYTVSRLTETGYINDSEYARRYFETASKNQGKKLSAYKLMAKGVRKDVIDEAYEKAAVPSKENAAAVAEKYMRNKEINKENLAKTYRYLIGRGFSYDEASEAISAFKEND